MEIKPTAIIISLFFLVPFSASGQSFSWTSLKTGFFSSLAYGTWFPDGKNAVLGNSSILGISLKFKPSKNAYGLSYDLIGGKTKTPIRVKYGNSMLEKQKYFGAQLMANYFFEFYDTKYFLFEAMIGGGFGNLTYHNPNPDISVDKASLLIAPGLNVSFFWGKKLFLQLRAQYCVANYKLDDSESPDFSGNYLLLNFSLGIFYEE